MLSKEWRPVKKSITSQKILSMEKKSKAIDLSNKNLDKEDGKVKRVRIICYFEYSLTMASAIARFKNFFLIYFS